MVHKRDPLTSNLNYVYRLDWLNVIEAVKQQCSAIATGFIQEHEQCFPTQDIMNATKVIYLQFWVNLKLSTRFWHNFQFWKHNIVLGSIWPKIIVGWNIVGAMVILFQDYYACQLPCNYEASYGLQFMHEYLDHLVQQPTSFPLIIWMAKTNWIVYGHCYGQHRTWEMFFKYGVYEE